MRSLPRDPFRLLGSYVRMLAVASRSRWGRARLTAPDGGPVVCMTSYGVRIGTVHLALESIGRGSLKPSRLIVWLDDEAVLRHPPRGLRRLRDRGVELMGCDDLGPHKKYFPYVQSISHHAVSMVTADDDTLYPRRWLETLAADHVRYPKAVLAHRVNHITTDGREVLPYERWGRATDLRATPRNYAVGVKGILYPPAFLDFLRRRGDAFRTTAPGSSDTWLHHCTLRASTPVLPVLELGGRGFWPIRGVRPSRALLDQNVRSGRNDRVRSSLWTPEDTALVLSDTWDVEALLK